MDGITITISADTIREEFIRLLTKAPDYHSREASVLTKICAEALRANLPRIEAKVREAVQVALADAGFVKLIRDTFEASLQEAVAAKAKSITSSMSQASLLMAMKEGT